MQNNSFDLVIIGAGIIGLATAYALFESFPHLKIALLEKETQIAKHQTGNNSGVIHSGIYYKPGSLKAKNCVEGVKKLRSFCDQNKIKYDLCGKLIVATTQKEIPKLHEIYQRGLQNSVPKIKLIQGNEIRDIEPHAKGLQAIYCPETGIVNYSAVSKKLSELITNKQGSFFFNEQVTRLKEVSSGVQIFTQKHCFVAKYVINCAGLYADKIARLVHPSIQEKIIPFRGEYYYLKREKQNLLKGLIYPVPNPNFPFLGVHLTKRLNGQVEVGPNAILAFSREGYTKFKLRTSEMIDYLSYPGFWKMALTHWKAGSYELFRSFSKSMFLKDAQKLMSSIEKQDLVIGGAGVRAQVVDPKGKLIDDFLIRSQNRFIHVLNAPSPAATSCLSIGESIAKQAHKLFNLFDSKSSISIPISCPI